MFPKKPTDKQIIGKIGEDYACEYLRKMGYQIVDRNYLKKWGEIDIVAISGSTNPITRFTGGEFRAKNEKKLHFVEVKSVTHITFPVVLSVHPANDLYRPEDNMHPWKLQRLSRVIQSYLLDKDVSDDIDWQFDVVTVYLDANKRLLKINFLEDIVL